MTFDLGRDETFPFPAFRDDPSDYAKAALFWETAFEDALDVRQVPAWIPWMPDPFRDGHPIFSRIDPQHRRGVLLQQVPPSDDPIWFKCWMARTENEERILPYLFIETHISLKSRTLFTLLITAWCKRHVREAEMVAFSDAIRSDPEATLHHLPRH